MSIVKVENLTKVYGKGSAQVTALDNVNFEVPKGQFLAIVGPSGWERARCSISWAVWTAPPPAAY